MLPPADFGAYLSTDKKGIKGRFLLIFQNRKLIDRSLNRRCVTKEDGKPKSSVYLSVYRVLETILAALKSLYLFR